MRSTTATVTFDFTFQYPRHGIYEVANSVTVCEPSFDKRQVHAKMSVYVADAQVKASKRFAEMQAGGEVAEPAPSEDAVEKDADFLLACRIGMDADSYSRFLDYVQGALTNAKSLAYIGDPEDRQPIVEEVWAAIAREGGLEAVNKVIGTFASFFSLVAVRPTKPNGSEPSSLSAPSVEASSPTRKPKPSRGPNS